MAYPATIGSSDTPSPTGTHEVARIAFNPEYTYNPNVNFKQGDNSQILTIPPGPNGPVGSIWIALSKPTYGIHGTPDPSKIGKTESHGCVRLTNWDAAELAKLVEARRHGLVRRSEARRRWLVRPRSAAGTLAEGRRRNLCSRATLAAAGFFATMVRRMTAASPERCFRRRTTILSAG